MARQKHQSAVGGAGLTMSKPAPVFTIKEKGRFGLVLDIYRGRQGTLRLMVTTKDKDYFDGVTEVVVALSRRNVVHLKAILAGLDA
jgi:hypothetical protein